MLISFARTAGLATKPTLRSTLFLLVVVLGVGLSGTAGALTITAIDAGFVTEAGGSAKIRACWRRSRQNARIFAVS